MHKCFGLLALVVCGCTEQIYVFPFEAMGGAPAMGDGDDLLDLDDDGSCCAPDDLALFTEGDAPCPKGTVEGFTAHAGFIAPEPHTCTECSCSPAACALPDGMLAFPAKCPGDGSTPLPFGPAPGSGWDGSCDQANAHPANELCDGALCVQSLSIPATTVTPCTPSTPTPSKPDWSWGRSVRQCRLLPQGCDAGQVCAPAVVPDAFDLCRYVAGDTGCPKGYFTERSVLYLGAGDDRGCEACDCAPAQGAQCEAYVSVYKDGACSSPVVQIMVSTMSLCVDVTSGSALGSTGALLVTDVPGTCTPSGGEPVGHVEPAQPVTLCCPETPK